MRISQRTENIKINQSGAVLNVSLSGDVLNYDGNAFMQDLQQIMRQKISVITFANKGLAEWDSSLLRVVYQIMQMAKEQNVECNIAELPENLQELIRLAFAVDRNPPQNKQEKESLLEKIGRNTVGVYRLTDNVIDFLGEVFAGFARFISFRSILRRIDFCAALEDCGPKAVVIVTIISFLVGLILAFVGAVQLQTFGAQIYVASLVTIGMCRIMGAIMVGIIMAGRTGSAYAATIGTMQVNEELDALLTMGISRIDFLVMPRILALLLAMPILTMLADVSGMLGGAFVGVFMMNLPYQEYYKYALEAFNLQNFLVGIFHGFCFGFIIAVCGCYSGLTCGRNADSVGISTTKSVVNAVVWMIVVTGVITVICMELGI